jgi:hypothetical protein
MKAISNEELEKFIAILREDSVLTPEPNQASRSSQPVREKSKQAQGQSNVE